MGSDVHGILTPHFRHVSIHAPAWGATYRGASAPRPLSVSIHAPAWGATLERYWPRSGRVFQFTLPHGERRSITPCQPSTVAFQFTLPHGERPSASFATVSLSRCFNSRSRMGSDAQAAASSNEIPTFQFTLPHGERQARWLSEVANALFQFTLPHGERRPRGRAGPPVRVSIHAPAWGATGCAVYLFQRI